MKAFEDVYIPEIAKQALQNKSYIAVGIVNSFLIAIPEPAEVNGTVGFVTGSAEGRRATQRCLRPASHIRNLQLYLVVV